MKKKLKVVAIILTTILSAFSFANKTYFTLANETYVEGPITRDTIWTLIDSPFITSKDVTIYPNATLIIEPGVEVKFGGDFSLIVSGKLYANGTSKPIKFISNREEPIAGDWGAIKFNGTEKSTLIGCLVAYAKDGILIENGNVEIKDSTISLCSQNGINATNSALTVQNTTIMENSGNGICINGNGHVTIQKSTIIANEIGILLTGNETSGVSISQNKISANKQAGIKIDADFHSSITIINNILSANNKGFYISSQTSTYITRNSISYNDLGFFYDIGEHTAYYNDIYGNEIGMDVASDATVNAEYNYWGDPSGPYHKSLNPMGKGNPVGGNGVNLDFIFFLTEPTSYINARPIAKLLSDKTLVPPNQTVMFFATDSFDERRVDKYFFNFGDGSNSSWTTLSVFVHKYSSPGNYTATVTVMDDFGATSKTAANVTISVQELMPLSAHLSVSNDTVGEGGQVSVMVYVTNGIAAMENASVKVFSIKGGNFTPSYGLTNSTGYFTSTFTAPDITQIKSVRIVATASKSGFADGSDYKYLEVIPLLSVEVTANPNVIKSEENAQVTVYVKSNEQPIAGAVVTVSTDEGDLSPETEVTDSSGTASFVFSAPQTTTSLNATIIATVTKDMYMEGLGQTVISIEPKILSVQVTAEPSTIISEAKSNVTLHVTYDMTPVPDANVTITSENGNFSATTGLTDSYGNVTFIFTAPQVNEPSNITITVKAEKIGYASSESQLKIVVNPGILDVQVIADPQTILSKQQTEITVYVTCNANPVAGASIEISSDGGSLSATTGVTDSNGKCTFTLNAPETSQQLSIVVTIKATKNGYVSQENQVTITVTAETVGGWSITTLLLIIIPIAIVIVVIVLIKLKVISISASEEME